jgi:hypothetical protein
MAVGRSRTTLALLALLAPLALAGCTSNGRPTPAPSEEAEGAPAQSVFAPVAMRAHPLTRVIRENGRPVRIEAHAEFFDRWGHTVKAVGILRFELEGAAVGRTPDPARTASEPLRWDPVDLRTPAASSRAYDPATGTYWARLDLPAGAVMGGSPTLTMVFTTVGGRRMSSTIELE